MAVFTRPRPPDIFDAMLHYLADTPDGSVGIVDGWERDELGQPQALSVAQGWFGRRRFEIPIERLLEIDHEQRRVLLARGAAPLEPKGPLQRLMELGQGRSSEEAIAAPPPGPHQARPVLCGVADDQHARTVVAVAARLARNLAAPLILAHVIPADVPPGVSAAVDGQARLLDEERKDADARIDALLSGLASSTAVKRIVARGTPAETLEHLAGTECAQLLVIGATGKGSLGALFRGSVSHHVIGHASCPVVVVPPDLTRPEDVEDEEPIAHVAGISLG